MSGTIFSICVTSAISAQFAALRISAPPAGLKRWRKGCKKRKEKKELWQSQKPTLNLVSHAATSSSAVQSPITQKSPVALRAPCQYCESTGKPVAREPNQKDAASSSQVWQKDAEMDESTRRPVEAEKYQELLNFHENLKSTRKLAASGN